MQPVIHPLCPPARTGPGQGSGPPCQIHHIQITPPNTHTAIRHQIKTNCQGSNSLSYCVAKCTHALSKGGFLLSPVVLFLVNIKQQPLLHTLHLCSNKHTHSHMHPLYFKGIPALSFRMQGDHIQPQTRHVSSLTPTRSHTAMLQHASKKLKKTKRQGKKDREMPYHFSHWSSIQPSSPSPPESIL